MYLRRLLSIISLGLLVFIVTVTSPSSSEYECKEIDLAEYTLETDEPKYEYYSSVNLPETNLFDKAMKAYEYKMAELSYTSNKEKWYDEYKELIQNNHLILIEPQETIYDCFSEEELNLLFRVVQAEIGDEYTFEQKANVASVIFNRLNHEEFGNTLDKVLVGSQFETVASGRYKMVEVSETTIKACEFAFEIEDDTNGALYFESKWSNHHKYYAKYIFTDEAHKFYK